jgi:hypothetical protein
MYLATTDITYSAGVLARFNKDPRLHWKAVKHLFHSEGLWTTILTYSLTSSSEPFLAFSDADNAGNPDNERSTSAYIVKMGTGATSWSSCLQSIVASSTEAEYIAVSAGQEMIWLCKLLSELGYTLPQYFMWTTTLL